jgi:hypothetical protein
MTAADWIGFVGVTILLLAFVLNQLKKIGSDSHLYIGLNFFGAALACLASVLINYIPFIILEAAWTVASLLSWIKLASQKR